MPIFADDSDIDAKRATALHDILESLPAAFRIPMRLQFEQMLAAMSEQQVAQVIEDIRDGKAAAERGDMEGLLKLARHWASDDQIREYLPMAENMLQTGGR